MINVEGDIKLLKGKEVSILRKHPWIFSGAIQSQSTTLKDGDWVRVLNYKGNILGFGHFQPGSIAVRILIFGEVNPSDDFYANKFFSAIHLRKMASLPSELTNAYRLIHGEGDGLPGLIIDIYNGVAVIQSHSTGMHEDRHQIAKDLKMVMKDNLNAIYYKNSQTLPGSIGVENSNIYLAGSGIKSHTVLENGYPFIVDWEEGQKTGFFLDQRENRKELQQYTKGKNVLNTFCYTGGFSVYALQGEANLVNSVDSSSKAIEMARRNLEVNGFDPEMHTCYAENTFDFLADKGAFYDVIILDPPAFAKHRSAKHQAVKGYTRLNAEAMRLIKSQGIIFTFSCSQVIDQKLFYDTIVAAGIQANREIKVLKHLTQPSDHPVSLFHPEGEYLKGLVLYVA